VVIVNFGQFFADIARNFRLLFSMVKVIYFALLTENGLDHTLGDFLTISSGHPDCSRLLTQEPVACAANCWPRYSSRGRARAAKSISKFGAYFYFEKLPKVRKKNQWQKFAQL
jgi:hypothetical protein